MKISRSWLNDWLKLDADVDALANRLTQSGLEVDVVVPVAGDFASVVVGVLEGVDPHPDADKLRVCAVAVGSETLQIVCGASNVYAGMHAPVALIGANLPGGLKIRKTKLRGVESHGMLCSARELGFGDDHSGIFDLRGAGEPGDDVRQLLDLDDRVIEVDLTPNRGDCLAMEGVAREVAAAFEIGFEPLSVPSIGHKCDASVSIDILSPDSCPRYAGRVIRNIDVGAATPIWLQERLRRGGIRPIHPVVDITNYVMLELGQPMHAFDLATLDGGIKVRRAMQGESLQLLDGDTVELTPAVTVIADHKKALAIAGVMGGEASGVTATTTDVLLESAFFDPLALAGVARSFGLHTDASHRFERGVDPALQERAIERATALMLEIVGGVAGPVIVAESTDDLPVRPVVALRRARLDRILGTEISDQEVAGILARLGMPAARDETSWTVTAPSHRFDIAIEEDLIEEIARIYGYGNVPEAAGHATLQIAPRSEDRLPVSRLKDQLVSRGYNEAVTYSFVDPEVQASLFPTMQGLALSNPIATNLSVMRLSLWPGLLGALQTNLSHRQARVRLFECGMRFTPQENEIKQDNVLSAVIAGHRYPEQWGLGSEQVDFYDVKSDVEALLALTGGKTNFMFNKIEHSALHPGRSAAISCDGRQVGWLGELHPALSADLGLSMTPQLFEIELDVLTRLKLPDIKEVSKYPEIRRDIAFLVSEEVTSAQIEQAVLENRSPVLKSMLIFDIYRGGSIDSGLKSVALGLILQDSSRTLTDEDADGVVADVAARLNKKLAARIRD